MPMAPKSKPATFSPNNGSKTAVAESARNTEAPQQRQAKSKLALVLDEIDVEVLATIVEYASSTTARRCLSVLPFRLVSRRWGAAAATALQRWIESGFWERPRFASSIAFPDVEDLHTIHYRIPAAGRTWKWRSRSELRCVAAMISDFPSTFFEGIHALDVALKTKDNLSVLLARCVNLEALYLKIVVGYWDTHPYLLNPLARSFPNLGRICPQNSKYRLRRCSRQRTVPPRWSAILSDSA